MSWSTLVDPQRDPGPVDVHGITRERLVGAPRFAEVAPTVAELLTGRVFVAHNAGFDWKFLRSEMSAAGVPLPSRQRLCTWRLAKQLDLPVENLKLSTLAAHWGIEQVRAHDAVDDTECSSRCCGRNSPPRSGGGCGCRCGAFAVGGCSLGSSGGAVVRSALTETRSVGYGRGSRSGSVGGLHLGEGGAASSVT